MCLSSWKEENSGKRDTKGRVSKYAYEFCVYSWVVLECGMMEVGDEEHGRGKYRVGIQMIQVNFQLEQK